MNEIILEISAFIIALFCVIDCIKNRRELYLPFPKGIRKKLQDQHFTYLILLVTLMVSALSLFKAIRLIKKGVPLHRNSR